MRVILFVLVFIVFSCNNEETLYQLKETNEIRIPIDSKTINISSTMHYYTSKNGVQYLCYFNSNQDEIQFYKMNDYKLSHKIKIKHEGEDAVPQIGGFWVVSLDSIILTPYSVPKFYIVNKKGNLIDVINFEYSKQNLLSTSYVSKTRISTPLVFSSGKLLIGQYPMGTWTNMSQLELMKSSICLEVDLKTDSIKFLPMGFPMEYIKKGASDFFYSRAFDGINMVYSFSQDHNIYSTLNHQEYNVIKAGSKFIKEFIPIPSNPYSSPSEITNYLVQNPKYTNIIYDAYREIYYRFVFIGHTLAKSENTQQLIQNRKEFSIMILSKKFEVLGETKMKEDVYNMDNFFVAKEGLYLSKSNAYNTNYTEDELVFGLMNFEGK
ncbi:MAG: DUF4221 family protein [Bacteroidales bacterium]|nr:DUF4221 family protein [Bacteroidales bacterium]